LPIIIKCDPYQHLKLQVGPPDTSLRVQTIFGIETYVKIGAAIIKKGL